MKKHFEKFLINMTDFLVKRKNIVIVITVLLCGLSIFLMLKFTKINSDMTSYLPKGCYTTDGYDFLKENFGIEGDLIITVTGQNYEVYDSAFKDIAKLNGVTTTIWEGSQAVKSAKLLSKEKYEYLYNILVQSGETEQDNIYACFVNMSYPASSDSANGLIDDISSVLTSYNLDFAYSGSTDMAKSILENTLGEIPLYLVVGFIVVIIILLLTTESFIEPLILVATLGVAILINMGTNFIFKEVSVVTYAAASIMQLGLSMDYAIFMMHRYSANRRNGLNSLDSAKEAVPYTFFTISSSALTTVGGFLALYFMSFKIGADMANVIMKGIVLSLLTVVLVQPVLLVLTDKVCLKTKHKFINIKMFKLTGFSMRNRKLVVAIAFCLLLPAIYLQGKLDFNYLKFEAEKENPTACEIYADKMINQILICVPIDENDLSIQYDFVDEISVLDNVDFVLGLCSIVDENTASVAIKMPSLTSQYVNNGYALYTVGLNSELESRETSELCQNLHSVIQDYFDTDYYLTGMAQGVEDFKEITPKDFLLVTIVSVIIIFVILWITLRSFRITSLLCVLIEFGIWINLGLSYLFGGNINFMSYIIISAIQLGSTIDYAILVATEYQNNRAKGLIAKNAAYNATTDSAMSIITSALIMFGACMSVDLISSNLIVSEITMLIARGALISAGLILFILPTTLTVCTKMIDKITALAYSKLGSDELLYDDENLDTEDYESEYAKTNKK